MPSSGNITERFPTATTQDEALHFASSFLAILLLRPGNAPIATNNAPLQLSPSRLIPKDKFHAVLVFACGCSCSQFLVEEISACPIRFNPTPPKQKVVNLVREN